MKHGGNLFRETGNSKGRVYYLRREAATAHSGTLSQIYFVNVFPEMEHVLFRVSLSHHFKIYSGAIHDENSLLYKLKYYLMKIYYFTLLYYFVYACWLLNVHDRIPRINRNG